MLIAGLRTICRQRFHNIIWNIKTSRHMRGFSMRVPYMKALCWPRNAVRQTTTATGSIQDPVASWENPSFLPPLPLFLSLNTPTSNSVRLHVPPIFLSFRIIYIYTRVEFHGDLFLLGLTLLGLSWLDDRRVSRVACYRGDNFWDKFRAR